MKLDYNCSGSDRKKLVQLIAATLNAPAKYLGAPTFSYQVDCITVNKNGVLQLNDHADPDWLDRLKVTLADSGFACLTEAYDDPQPEPAMAEDEVAEESSDAEPSGICISVPRTLFTDGNLANLHSIVEAKGSLIRKALGASSLPIEVTEFKVSFPWFPEHYTADELNTYGQFITKLCDMARNQKRITAKDKEVDNEKYAFRCFLLRLGFIGDEYKTARKILLRNLSGSSAFKAGQQKGAQA